MLDFKFHHMPRHAHFFAQRMFLQLRQSPQLAHVDLVSSVPLSKKRLRQRGYNQSELIARELAALSGIPYSTVLEKHVENREQHRLHKKDRRENVRGVYRILSGASVEDRRVLLVDDILTTGATLGECAAVLYAAGAKEVFCAAACRVPTRPESFSS
jgi:ComF family protein